MGTTAEKGQRVLQSIAEVQEGINNLGGNLTDQTPFKNFRAELDNIYNNFPKTSYAEGSNITLSNTLKGKLDFEDGIVGIGDTQQNGTPTPDSPVDIEVVRGKNLINCVETHNALTNGAIYQIDNALGINSYIKCEPNTTYSITFQHDNPSAILYVGYKDINGTYTERIFYDTSRTFTTPSNAYYLFFYVFLTTGPISTIGGYVQLEKGSQATSYLPYNTIEVVERGKNVLPNPIQSQTLNGITVTRADDGTLTFNGTSTANTYFDFSTEFDTTKYRGYKIYGFSSQVTGLSIRISESDRANIQSTNTNGTAINDNGIKYIAIRVASGTTLTNYVLSPMILAPTDTATTYEPYKTPHSYQLSLGEYEFAKIGNYVDTIEYDVDEDKVYKNEAITRKILTGANTEFWQVYAITGAYVFAYGVTNYKRTNELICMCNYFKAIANGTYGSMTDGQCRFRYYNDELYNFYACMDDITNVNDFKTWLGTHNLDLYYVLATPTKTEITGTLKDQIKALYNSHSFTGTTIIEIDGQLPLIIKVRALKGE